NEVLNGFGQDLIALTDFVLARAHAFVARDEQGLGFIKLPLAGQGRSQHGASVERVPGSGTIGFAARQTLAVERFGFGEPLLAAERGGERAQGDLQILSTRVLAAKGEHLAEAGLGFSKVALVEKSVAATVKGIGAERIAGP